MEYNNADLEFETLEAQPYQPRDEYEVVVDESSDPIWSQLTMAIKIRDDCEFGIEPLLQQFLQQHAGPTTDKKLLIDAHDREGWTLLSYAAFQGHVEAVEMLVDKYGANVDIRNGYDATPFMLACLGGHLGIMKWLFDRDHLLLEMPNKYGSTALMAASGNGNLEIVQWLLDQNANVHAENNMGATALDAAASHGCMEVARLLIEHEAKVNKSDKNGFTPLMAACTRGHLAMCRLLVAHFANVNAVTTNNENALTVAVQYGHTEIVRYLISKRVGLNLARTRDGVTPLMLAAQRRNVELFTMLLSNHADSSAKTIDGRSIADFVGESDDLKNVLRANGHHID